MPPRNPNAAVAAPSKYGAKDFFSYGVLIQGLAPGATATGTFTIDAGWDFLWTKAMAYADIAGTVDPNLTLLTITIQQTGSGRFISNIPLPIAAYFGTGQLPFILPTPKLFQARASVQISVTNNGAANTYANLWLDFAGTQLFLA